MKKKIRIKYNNNILLKIRNYNNNKILYNNNKSSKSNNKIFQQTKDNNNKLYNLYNKMINNLQKLNKIFRMKLIILIDFNKISITNFLILNKIVINNKHLFKNQFYK